MKGFWLAIAWTCATCLRVSQLAAEDAPAPDEVITQWQEAFQNCRRFQAKVTRYVYERKWDQPDETLNGEFYCEPPGNGRFQVGDFKLLWLHGDLFYPLAESKGYWQFTAAYLDATRQEVVQLERRPPRFCFVNKVGLYREFASPASYAFLAPWQDHEAWRDKYDFSTSLREGHVMLTAVTRPKQAHRDDKEWSVILDPQTHLPWAVEQIDRFDKRRVLVLSDVRINETPADRNRLLSLEHPEWKVLPFDWLDDDNTDY